MDLDLEFWVLIGFNGTQLERILDKQATFWDWENIVNNRLQGLALDQERYLAGWAFLFFTLLFILSLHSFGSFPPFLFSSFILFLHSLGFFPLLLFHIFFFFIVLYGS